MQYFCIFACILGITRAQLTAQTSTAPLLRECYDNATLINRNNLPPATMPVLIDIIRSIEDSTNNNLGLRQLAVALLHSYRQDGLEYHAPTTTASNVLPYSPTYSSFSRHKLLLTYLIPNNLATFGNDTISPQLKCGIHHMISSTVALEARGDEGTACSQLSQYRSLRGARSLDQNDDVEILDPSFLHSANENGQYRQYNPNDDVESAASAAGAYFERQIQAESQCPLADGVVYTKWGAVSAGSVIAGIAAGAERQRVPLASLVKGDVHSYTNVPATVDNLYPATLTGDLAEAVLLQGISGSQNIFVGAPGNWNSTQAQKHFLLLQRTNLQMTDPEIRGDVDGFILGNYVTNFLSTYSNLKLSQILDMYYSARNGVFDSAYRACNRQQVIATVFQSDTMISEAYAFTVALDSHMSLPGTITSGVDSLVTSAVSNLQSYISNSLSNIGCTTSETDFPDYRLRTNLYLVVDASWQYQNVYPAISYLLDHIEVSRFGSSVTLLSAVDGSIIVNKTFSLAEFHSQYTQARHSSIPSGVNLATAITNIRNLTANELDLERTNNYVGGNATILLFLLNTLSLSGGDQEYVVEQARLLNDTVPDLRVIFATSSNQQGSLWNVVREQEDIVTVTLNNPNNIESPLLNLINRINTVNRRIVNPLCGSTWQNENSDERAFDDYIEPGYTNFYTISPNYFYVAERENRRLRITRSGTGNLVVCHSRTNRQPRQNSTNTVITAGEENQVTCQTLSSVGNVEISLHNACDGYWTINSCPPLYVSVHSEVPTSITASCTDVRACRFPYNVRYSISVVDLGCYSSARGIFANLTVVIIASLFLWMF